MHQHVGSLVPLFVLALSFTLAYEATGCLLVPIFMHALFNALNIALLGAAGPE
jgi:membrane protease YdiL (CAAX protease family)